MNTDSTLKLLSPVRLGELELPNRVLMAPMTRNRAAAGNVPTDLNATYYAQRASAGLIVTEATQVSPRGVGYPGTPGIHTRSAAAGDGLGGGGCPSSWSSWSSRSCCSLRSF